jgi:predicted DNA-binding protein (MmcQ/YjbR family)
MSDDIPLALLERVRKICAKFPDTSETLSWGHPTFRVGKKAFAVIERYKGELGIVVKVGMELQDVFLKDPRFFGTPYARHNGWVTLRVDAAPLNWREVGSLLKGSYRLVNSTIKR